MSESIDRRTMLRHLVVLSASVATPAWLLGCKGSKPSCTDVTGLSPDDVNVRNVTAAYVDQTPDATKKCSGCVQYLPAAAANACGGCKVVKGPINPEGWCKLYVPKPA